RRRRGPHVLRELLRQEEVQLLAALPAVDQLRNDDGPADAVPEDVHFEERLWRAGLLAEVVVGVPVVAARVIPARASQLVRPRLGDNLNEAARLTAIFRGVAAGDDGDFADRVDVRGDVRRAVA